jgi:hypothetical protein
MERTEAAAGPVGRPRPWLVITLGVVVAVYAVTWLWPGKSAAPSAPPSNPRVAATATATAGTQAQVPDVRLDALKMHRPGDVGGQRNPFRFYVPPPPPAPPPPVPTFKPPVAVPQPPIAPADIGPPQPPPITLKFIGILEGVPEKGKVAAFSDCRSTMHGKEGDIIDGRYRLVRIGIESVVMEYPDGRGRTTIRMSGQECVTK